MPPESTAFDIHRELVRTRQQAEWNTLFVAGMATTLSSIHGEITAVRRATADALAAQQELLNREAVQAKLEEFVYQAERMMAAFDDTDGGAAPSTRYFLLTGMLQTVRAEGLSTAVIRRRDNKAAFDAVVRRAETMAAALEANEDVKDALAWADRERERRIASTAAEEEDRQRKADEADRRRLAEKAEQVRKKKAHRVRLAELRTELADLYRSGGRLEFAEWYAERFDWAVRLGPPVSILVQIGVWLFLYGFVWIPAWYAVYSLTTNGAMAPGVQADIQGVKDEMRELEENIRSL